MKKLILTLISISILSSCADKKNTASQNKLETTQPTQVEPVQDTPVNPVQDPLDVIVEPSPTPQVEASPSPSPEPTPTPSATPSPTPSQTPTLSCVMELDNVNLYKGYNGAFCNDSTWIDLRKTFHIDATMYSFRVYKIETDVISQTNGTKCTTASRACFEHSTCIYAWMQVSRDSAGETGFVKCGNMINSDNTLGAE